eukprot:gene11592-biopygen8751
MVHTAARHAWEPLSVVSPAGTAARDTGSSSAVCRVGSAVWRRAALCAVWAVPCGAVRRHVPCGQRRAAPCGAM